MLEGDFNLSIRTIMRAQGLKAIHIREADDPGASDLIVAKGPRILAWAELKMDNEPLRPSQVEFLRAMDTNAGNAFVLRMHGNTGIVSVERPLKTDGWSTDNKKLIVIHRTQGLDFDWATGFARWKR